MDFLNCKKLRIALKAYESKLLDDSCQQIIDVVNKEETKVVGPIPLPTKRRIYCVLRSPLLIRMLVNILKLELIRESLMFILLIMMFFRIYVL